MIRIIYICILTFLFQSCESDNPFTNFDYRLINQITVSDVYVKDGRGVLLSGKGVDVIDYNSKDKNVINDIFSLYLNNGRKGNFKMFYYYKLTFEYKQESYSVLVGKDCVSFNGIAYKLDGNLESYLETKLKIKKRMIDNVSD